MKILLIDILRTSLEEVWPSAEHSLGLMYLSASLKKKFKQDVDVRIWTLVSKPKKPVDDMLQVISQLQDFNPDVVGIRCLSIGKDIFHLIAETVKQWDEKIFLAAGGPYPTDDYAGALNSGHIDCVVIGEGEITFNELIENLYNKRSWKHIHGIAYSENGNVYLTSPRQPLNDLDLLPLPDYKLVDFERFSNMFLTFTSKISKPHANIMTTRGCPYRCAYCHNILGKKFRARSPENVLAEIRFIHDKFGITDFQIIDDIFNLDMNRAKRICDLIIKSGMKLTLSFPNAIRGDRVDEELIDKMAEAGTKFISYAIETASTRLQKLINKNLDLDKLFKAIEYTTKTGIITRGFFMIGFPTETESEVLQTIEYANQSLLCGATFFTVVYFPGTEMYKMARSLGYFTDENYEVQRDYVNIAAGPYDFPVETLDTLKKKAIKEFAFTEKRIKMALNLLPGYFTQREIDGFFMAYVVSSRDSLDEIENEYVKEHLRRYFAVADKFSKKSEYYV